MKYIQFITIIIIIVNAIMVLPEQDDGENKPYYCLVYDSSAIGLFLGGFCSIGILSLALSLISTLCYTATWIKEWTNEDVRNGRPKGKTVLFGISQAAVLIIVQTVTFFI